MTASLTARRWQQAQSSPAAPTDDAGFPVVDDASTARARDREDEIAER
jgi:hypothetical protein